MLNEFNVKIITTEGEFDIYCDDWECNNNNGIIEMKFKNADIVDGFSKFKLKSNVIIAEEHLVCAFAREVD